MKTKYILLIVVIAVAIAAVISTYQDASSYANFGIAAEHPNKEFHVVGELVTSEPMVYDALADANYFSFHLKDEEGKIRKVEYNQPKPTDFEKSEKVVVVGQVRGDDAFTASQILLKCPSKYEEDLASN